MPDKDIQDFDTIASADGADYALVVDTSDTTDDPGGSLKKVLISNGGAGGLSAPTIYDLSATGFTLDSGNEIDIDVSGVKGLVIVISEGAVGTSETIALRFSADGGSTFRSTGYKRNGFNSGGSFTNDQTYLILTNSGTAGLAGHAQVFGFNNASIKASYLAYFGSTASGGAMQIGNNGTAEAVDTVRVFTVSGNAMTAGQLLVWLIL